MIASTANFLWLLFFKRGATLMDIARGVLQALLVGCLFVVVAQQTALYYEIYNGRLEEFQYTTELWHENNCSHYSGRMQERHDACRRYSITLTNSPWVSALSHLAGQWNSCLYMPCGQMLVTVSQSLLYKTFVILLSLGVASYLWRLITVATRKYNDLQESFQVKETQQHLEQVMKQVNTMEMSSTQLNKIMNDGKIDNVFYRGDKNIV